MSEPTLCTREFAFLVHRAEVTIRIQLGKGKLRGFQDTPCGEWRIYESELTKFWPWNLIYGKPRRDEDAG